MKLNELTGEYKKQRAICYKKDGNSITYHYREMQYVRGNVYSGHVRFESEYSQYCMLYVLFPGQKVAMELGEFNARRDIEETMEICKSIKIDTQEAFIDGIKRRIKDQDYIQLTYVEYLKYIDPSLVDACWESRKAFAEKREQIRQERKAQRDAEDQKYVAERNAEMEKQIAAAYEVIRNGGTLENSDVSIYESRYNCHTYKIVNYLFRQHGVNCPIKTQGWINEKLIDVTIKDGGEISTHYWKRSNSNKVPNKFHECMFALIRKVRDI